MRALKEHVKNKARPKASIAYIYLFQETQEFVSNYLQGFKPMKTRVWYAKLEDANEYVVLEGAHKSMIFSIEVQDAAHQYMLQNNTLMNPLYK